VRNGRFLRPLSSINPADDEGQGLWPCLKRSVVDAGLRTRFKFCVFTCVTTAATAALCMPQGLKDPVQCHSILFSTLWPNLDLLRTQYKIHRAHRTSHNAHRTTIAHRMSELYKQTRCGCGQSHTASRSSYVVRYIGQGSSSRETSSPYLWPTTATRQTANRRTAGTRRPVQCTSRGRSSAALGGHKMNALTKDEAVSTAAATTWKEVVCTIHIAALT
jgi:hypothetical protein